MPTTLEPQMLLVTLKYDFKVMQRESSPNEVITKMIPQGCKFFWGTVGNPGSVRLHTRHIAYQEIRITYV